MTVPVSAVLLEKDGEFLVMKRPADSRLSGFWEFPGGKKSADENWLQCACRELREETGLLGENLREIAVSIFSYPETAVEIHFFYCRQFSGELNTKQEFQWLQPGEMNPADFPEANREVIEWLKKRNITIQIW